MKKIYKAPLTKVVKIKSERMLQASITDVKGGLVTSGGSVTSGTYDPDSKDDDDAFDDLW